MIQMRTLGSRLRRYREAANLDQKELAQKAKVSQPTIAVYEQGKRDFTVKTLYKITNALEISLIHVFSEGSQVDVDHESELSKRKLKTISHILNQDPPPNKKEKRRAYREIKKVLSA